jgi:tRNA pseudouridine55 synthase
MDGVLVIDKPAGLTSHDVVAVARRCLGERRIGHTGTLDPMATGVLPLVCGRATRLARFLTSSTKDYVALVRFGLTTDSCDITGREVTRSGLCPTAGGIEAALVSLRGEYLQEPPAFSAKRVGGQRAYSLARRQQPTTLSAVPVQVSRAELTALDADTASFVLTCSAGFYVRAFARTIGELVGTGACLASLRRTRSGEFSLTQAVPISAVQEASGQAAHAALIPMGDLLTGMPSVLVTEDGRRRIAHGRELLTEHRLAEPSAGAPGSGRLSEEEAMWVRVLDESGSLLALATRRKEVLHPSVVLI